MHPYPKECDGCPQRSKSLGYCPPDMLHSRASLVVYGESPGEDEVRCEAGFVGKAGSKLRVAEARAGFRVEWPKQDEYHRPLPPVLPGEVLHSNIVLCRPPMNLWPGDSVATECWNRHLDKHKSLAGLPWVSCGAAATEFLTDWRFKPVTERGTFLPLARRISDSIGKEWLVATLHPSFIARGGGEQEETKAQDQLLPLLSFDLRKAASQKGPSLPSIRVATSMEIWGAYMGAKPKLVALDLEGFDKKITVLGVSWSNEESWACWWDSCAKDLVQLMLNDGVMFVMHNASHDVGELYDRAGIDITGRWVDTINTAALVDPSVPLNLQSQVMSHVPGAFIWKGLVDHSAPYAIKTGSGVEEYRAVTSIIYSRMNHTIPAALGLSVFGSGWWYRHYCAVDAGRTFQLSMAHREALGARARYYREIMQPLQHPLLVMGRRGLPVDENRMEFHRKACLRVEKMARDILVQASSILNKEQIEAAARVVQALEDQREAEYIANKVATGKKGRFSKGSAMAAARTKLRNMTLVDGFNPDSSPQRIALIQDALGLPLSKGKNTKGPSTDDASLEKLLKRLELGRIKPRKGVSVEHATRVLRAMMAAKKWATWRRNFLKEV